jgi:hypothetical protein
MRTTALLLVTVLLAASPARAEDPAPRQRTFLSGLGLGLLIGGLVGVGAGAGGLIGSNDASARLGAYGSTVAPEEQASVSALQQRMAGGATLAAIGFVAGGLALAGGITCLLLDTPRASVAFVPTSQGGVLVFSGRF